MTPCLIVQAYENLQSRFMANVLLKFGLWGLGLSAVFIGGALVFFGGHAVANFFAGLMRYFYDVGGINDLATPNAESEFRFFGMMFVFYGGVLIQTVRRLEVYSARVPILLAVFFMAGLARLKSRFDVGQPHDLFTGLMIIEIGLPVLLFILWKLRKAKAR